MLLERDRKTETYPDIDDYLKGVMNRASWRRL